MEYVIHDVFAKLDACFSGMEHSHPRSTPGIDWIDDILNMTWMD